MRKEHFFQKMSDGIEISVIRWLPDEKVEIKGIVQLSHGMVEHALRYEEFAKALTDAGFVFNAHDHRGHGQTAEWAIEHGTGDFGILAESDGFTRVVKDLDEIILRCQHDFPGAKIILFGHSFGSFVSQAYIEKYAPHINACILAGTRGPNPAEVFLGKIVTHIVCAVRGRRATSPFVKKLMFGASNKKISDAQTASDWLSRDKEEVQKYVNDKWCNFMPTSGFYADMMDGLGEIHKDAAVNAIPKNLPIFLIAGEDDPVGAYGVTVKRLYDLYKKVGIENVSLKLYPEARHELLNETNKAEVTEDVIQFITNNC